MKTSNSIKITTVLKSVVRGLRTHCATQVTLLLLALPAVAQAEDYLYTANNGMVTIRGYTGSGGAVIIPSAINGLPVTSIGYRAFYNQWRTLTGITIPNSVLSIEDEAFAECSSLTNASIGNGVTSIGSGAFSECDNLTSVTIGASVISIGDKAFYNLGRLASVALPNTVTSIGNEAFARCHGLTNIIIGNRVTTIGAAAFSSSGLPRVVLPNSVTRLGDEAFMQSALTNIAIPGNITNIGTKVFFDCDSLVSVTISNGVTSIGASAFGDAGRLASVTIGDSVTSIGDQAFARCGSLTSISIPSNVLSVGSSAFATCTSLTSAMIGNGVTNLGNEAFTSCGNLTTVTVGSGVTSIGDGAFSYCDRLTGAYFKGNVPDLGGSSVFAGTYNATVYCLSGTAGWGPTFAGRPTALWGACVDSLLPATQSVSASGGTKAFAVITASGACSWLAMANQDWLHTTSTGGSNGVVRYMVDPNPSATPRTGTITVGDQTFTITQSGPGWTLQIPFGLLWDTGTGWYGGSPYGWMWFDPTSEWIWSETLQGWLASTSPDSRTLYSPQFRYLTPSATDPYKASTTAIGEVYVSMYQGTAIPISWVVSERFGYVWANGDGKWFYSDTYGWLGVTERGSIWSVDLGRFLVP